MPASEAESRTPVRIRIANVHKTYRADKLLPLSKERGSRGSGRALRGLDLEIVEGENVGIVGESGCGKTTLTQIIVNMLAPDKGGVVEFLQPDGGLTWPRVPLRKRRRYRNRIQYVFQHPGRVLAPNASSAQLINEGFLSFYSLRRGFFFALRRKLSQLRGLLLHGRAALPESRDLLLQDMELDADQLNSTPRELSGGEQKRVLLAKSLAAMGKFSNVTLRRAVAALLAGNGDPVERRRARSLLAVAEPAFLKVALVEEFAEAIEEALLDGPDAALEEGIRSANGLFNWEGEAARAVLHATLANVLAELREGAGETPDDVPALFEACRAARGGGPAHGLPLRRAAQTGGGVITEAVEGLLASVRERLAALGARKPKGFDLPMFLILDEPMRGIDSVNKLSIVRDFQQTRGAVTLIVITHDIHILKPLCDRIVVMHNGLIQEIAPPRDLPLQPDAPESAFRNVHPYTAALIRGRWVRGSTDEVLDDGGCPYRNCCEAYPDLDDTTRSRCDAEPPPLAPLVPNDPKRRLVRCWRLAPPPSADPITHAGPST